MYQEIELSEEFTKQLDITKHNQANQDHIIQDLHQLVPHEKPGEISVEFRNIQSKRLPLASVRNNTFVCSSTDQHTPLLQQDFSTCGLHLPRIMCHLLPESI